MTGRVDRSAGFAGPAGGWAPLGRVSTAERVADVLRERIIEGLLRPGARLSEEAVGTALGVSRNTLREAFRLLSHERLVVHRLNRGVFVRALTPDDVADLFRARRLIEGSAIAEAGRGGIPAARLEALATAVADGERAAARGRGADIGTANMRFHQAVAALAGSVRIDESMRRLLAELRLAFQAMEDPEAFHGPYLHRNRAILTLLGIPDLPGAQRALTSYLDDAERELLAGY